jgi:hypothetical protein
LSESQKSWYAFPQMGWMYKLLTLSGMVTGLAFGAVPFPKFSAPKAVTSGPHDHLLASYFGINSWSPDGRYITVLETDVKGRLATENDPAKLGLVDLRDGNRWMPLAETRCWNFQEAAMAHWLASEPDTIIYNDTVDGKFASVVLNWKTKARRVVPWPVSAVSPDGLWAVSINYARLRLTRPDYGYGGPGQDARAATVWPKDDGLWLVNLKTGEGKLIVPIDSVRDRMPQIQNPDGMAYFCHTVFSRDGGRIFWLARTVEKAATTTKGTKWETTAFTCNRDGTDVRRCFPDGWAGSHFNWRDGETMVITAQYKAAGIWSHVLFTVGSNEYRRIGGGLLDWDGHCVFSPDGKWMTTDGYWDKLNERKLVVVRMEDEAMESLGTFFVPEVYRDNFSRCDLHNRWRADGKQLGFNSVHDGTRQVYIMDVEGE